MWYKQEGEAVPFTCWPWMMAMNKMAKPYFQHGFKIYKTFGYKHCFEGWYDKDEMDIIAKQTYINYCAKKKIGAIQSHFLKAAKHIEKTHLSAFDDDLAIYPDQKLIALFEQLWKQYEQFWAYSLFIDAFDAGYDGEQIKKIAREHGLSIEEISILTTPEEKGFAKERLHDLIKILNKLFRKKNQDASKMIETLEMRKYIKKFDWYLSTYAVRKPIQHEQLIKDIEAYKNGKKRRGEYGLLANHENNQKQKIAAVLKKHGLKENPLYFFQKITLLREERKKYNLIGICLLHRLLEAVEKKRGINKEHLNYLNFDEFRPLLENKFDPAILKERYNKGVLITVEGTSYKETIGEEAWKEKERIDEEILEKNRELKGFVACRGNGNVTGTVRLVISRSDFDSFMEGEILVTGMTRPEHVPLMKKAAAIVTNEGGITCHAAIVSRELNVPCIIGTKVATRVLKTGDVVEVDANNGTVRKL